MDLNKLSDISMWDVRNVYTKVKNVVMNYTEMEIKVNEATGPEPWGASSTLMNEIADGTHSTQKFEEIMTAIYIKFNDTDPGSWRQVYKALQLIEYLIKNGSEHVVEDIRGHITVIKMLKNFHHIDANGKDQGINVRIRSKEIVDLVQDNERVKEERKKAKANRNKYLGQGSGGSSKYTGFGNTSSKYSGFGSSSISASNRYYDSDNDYPGEPYTRGSAASSSTPSSSARKSTTNTTGTRLKSQPQQPAAQPEEADLFSFDDVPPPPSANTTGASNDIMSSIPAISSAISGNNKITTPVAATNDDDDDWGDFEGGGVSSTTNKSAPATTTMGATGSIAAVDLMGGDGLMDSSFQPQTTSPPAMATSTKQEKQQKQPEQKPKPNSTAAFSDIWDMKSDLLSLDSLSLSNKNQSNSSSTMMGQQQRQGGSSGLSMNQMSEKI